MTLKQIAVEFNVSVATVSKALKDSHEISSSTKDKIQQYAKKHNYSVTINTPPKNLLKLAKLYGVEDLI